MTHASSEADATVPAQAASARHELIPDALADLCDDLDELLFLCLGAAAELARAARDIVAAPDALHGATRDLMAAQIEASRHRYRAAERRLLALRRLACRCDHGHGGALQPLVGRLTAGKAELADLLRVEQLLTAALAGAADWQSPSFLHSTVSAAGRHHGRIRAHWNDYKRDRHLDAEAYESRYVAALVDGPPGLRALLTSCGMAAFTTVLACLQAQGGLDGPILVGSGLYHESRLLLERALPGRIQPFAEADTPALLQAVAQLRPSAIFLDSLSNTKWMPVPELARVLEALRGTTTALVVDNTGLAATCQPFALADESVRLIVWESLLKYAQLGFDRASAGVIVARGADAALLADCREHLGTNVTDVAVHALPPPDRRVLVRRLGRLQRNASLLAERLREETAGAVEIVYPGLAGHPCARAAQELDFRGSCVSIVFPGFDPGLRRERTLVEAAVAEAARRGVPLIGGSSFGFDTCRIYLTAARAEHGEPFVRIAAGTEHRIAVEALAETLGAAIRGVAAGRGPGAAARGA